MVQPTVHPADRLLGAIEELGTPICVGIDPVLERLPSVVRAEHWEPVVAIERFCAGVLQAVAGVAPCVKFQSACFERYGSAGVASLERLVSRADALGLIVILDAKRGDIGVSAEHYAKAAFGHRPGPDWLTVNSYLGEDGLRPFLVDGRGAFALVRTSNPGGDALQTLALADGRAVSDAVADMVAGVGREWIGKSGYSSLGAVVGATKAADAARLRLRMPQQVFLVPGYGAQGAGPADVLACFNADGRGAIVTASRSVIFAFEMDDAAWINAVRTAAARFREEIAGAMRGAGVGAR
jgi:orotidine-5'-phosphate decarboxylase